MKNGITDLRNHLFEVIERLKDPDHKTPMDCETAESICLVAKRLLESAEVEIKYRNLFGKTGNASKFLADQTPEPQVMIAQQRSAQGAENSQSEMPEVHAAKERKADKR